MFTTEDVCSLSQQALVAEGFGKTLPGVLRALVEAGLVWRQPGRHGSRIPTGFWRWQKCHDPPPP
jgi:hypothetical protein